MDGKALLAAHNLFESCAAPVHSKSWTAVDWRPRHSSSLGWHTHGRPHVKHWLVSALWDLVWARSSPKCCSPWLVGELGLRVRCWAYIIKISCSVGEKV